MDFLQPLIVGLLGSFHCMGMCGPIALSLPLKEDSWMTRIISGLLYNLGRVFTYGFLGFIFGFLGFGIHIWGIQQWISIGVGAILILSVAIPAFFHVSVLTQGLDKVFGGFKRYFGKFFGYRTYFATLVIGCLNGFLPCGLVYVALAGALLSNTPPEGAMHMMIFGIGTIPAMLAISLLGNVVSMALRRMIQKTIPFLVILIGILFILRGMNLGIPYLSPKMDQKTKHKTEQLQKPECCH